MQNIASLTVTYNRVDKLKKNIECLLNQKYNLKKIYIVDNNSTDSTEEYIKSIKDNRICYYKLPQNIGGSGGFSKGIDLIANDKEIDYIWGMDDDAYPNIDALENIIKIKKEDTRNCYYSNNDEDVSNFEDGKKEVNDWMFVGFFIPTDVVRKIGLPRNDFFIYHDDSEYAHRVNKNNIKIIKVKDSIIFHDNNAVGNNVKSKKIFGVQIKIPNIPNWKMYYFVRNNILEYNWNEKIKYKIVLFVLPKFIIRILLVNPKQVFIAIKGYCDGILGKTGKRVEIC